MTSPTDTVLSDLDTDRAHRIYRHLHAHPELSMKEYATADFVAAELEEMGIGHFRCGGTGVVGVIRNGDGPVVAFRADTDGLPIAEDTGLEYASAATGTLEDGTVVPVMHGCGHDTHVTSLLSAARAHPWHRSRGRLRAPGGRAGLQARRAMGLPCRSGKTAATPGSPT